MPGDASMGKGVSDCVAWMRMRGKRWQTWDHANKVGWWGKKEIEVPILSKKDFV